VFMITVICIEENQKGLRSLDVHIACCTRFIAVYCKYQSEMKFIREEYIPKLLQQLEAHNKSSKI
jgi:hypothetical protein